MDKAEALRVVLKEHGIDIGRSGNISCPFHPDETPSMSLERQKGLYRCHSCGRGGDVFTLLNELQGMTFEEASAKLGGGERMTVTAPLVEEEQRIGIVQATRVAHLETLLEGAEERAAQSDRFAAYLKGRGLTEATVKHFRLGMGTPAMGRVDQLVVPYLGPNGRPLSLRTRCIEPHEHVGHGKYQGSAGERTRMFNTNAVINDPVSSRISVAEGEIDTMSLHQAGLTAVGFPGVNNIKPHHITILRGYDEVLLWCDNDQPGREMSERLMAALPRARQIHLPEGDVNATLVAHGEHGIIERI